MCESSKNARLVMPPSCSPSSPIDRFSATLYTRIRSSVPPHARYLPCDDTATHFSALVLQLNPKSITATSSSPPSSSTLTFHPNRDLHQRGNNGALSQGDTNEGGSKLSTRHTNTPRSAAMVAADRPFL